MPENHPPVALIIGASRSLALAEEYVNRGWHVVATVRGSARTHLQDLADRFDEQLEIETVDIVDSEQVTALH